AVGGAEAPRVRPDERRVGGSWVPVVAVCREIGDDRRSDVRVLGLKGEGQRERLQTTGLAWLRRTQGVEGIERPGRHRRLDRPARSRNGTTPGQAGGALAGLDPGGRDAAG